VRFLLLLLTPILASAQGTKEDYDRATNLPGKYQGTVIRDRVEPHMLPGGTSFWYRVDLPEGEREFVLVDAVKGERKLAFDAPKLAKALSDATGKAVDPKRLPIDDWTQVERQIHLKVGRRTLVYDPAKGEAKPGPYPVVKDLPSFAILDTGTRPRSGSANPQSPDKRWRMVYRDHNLFLKEEATGKETQVVRDGKDGDGYNGPFRWSADSRFVVAWKYKRGGDRQVTLVEAAPRNQLQPRVVTYPYLKPGDPIPQQFPVLIDTTTQKEVPLDRKLFENPWAIEHLRWDPDGKRFTFFYNERGHRVMRVLAVEAATGTVSPIINEECKTYFDYAHKFFYRTLDESGEILWMSERSGWNHLYRIDAKTGEVKNPITQGEWVVRDVLRLDPEARQVWFRAGGVNPGEDPYHVHVGRVDFDGKNLTWLTEGDGSHEVRFSSDGKYLIDSWSRVDLAPRTVLRDARTGKKICDLETADTARLDATGWKAPERFVTKGRDDATDIHGVIWRPSNFDPAKKYPVIEYIYAGPQGAFTPKRLSIWQGPRRMAELGFIVVQMDGMGTSLRSKAFHDVSWKNLGDGGFPDRIKWIKAAAAKYPQMDLTRVGIYGGSAGGQNALRALLAHGDFYHAAVADCGCHDNRMDKIWWNELYMSWPIGPHYEAASNVVHAGKLTGKLLLIVGEVDRNVDPASTMQVAAALVKANRDFELLVVPGAGHGAAETPYGNRRRMDFFVRHLLGVEPRKE
jgi:dipeptidyl aminopeptidase/acylaminoacyl peptidase